MCVVIACVSSSCWVSFSLTLDTNIRSVLYTYKH